jgi:electron transport complex protein RnfD
MKILTVSPSPHVSTTESVPKLMYGVIIALLPALAVSIFYFGIGMIIVTLTAVASAVLFEFLIQRFILKQNTTHLDGSAALTGLLLAFCLPTNLPVWMVALGSLVAIGVGKMTFGGLGNNPFNPALVGRVFLFISFPAALTAYPEPGQWWTYLDATTGATPLSILNENTANGIVLSETMNSVPTHLDLFLGRMKGSAGEIAAFALILGLFYMIWRKIITWHIPITIILTVFIFTGALWLANDQKFADPVFHLLTGGLMLGALYMATDYVTSPMSRKGMIIYGVGIGIVTVLIRVFGSYPEGVQFAILLMNGFTPLLNKYIKPKRFGEVKNC